jgi:ribulose 1,5-bisphosphate carboxylase large subunit-like protein
MEILLGKMLFLKSKENIPYVKFESDKRYSPEERFEEVMNFANQAFDESGETRNYAVNAVIDLIDTLYFEPVLMDKNQKDKVQKLSDITAYKSILTAA